MFPGLLVVAYALGILGADVIATRSPNLVLASDVALARLAMLAMTAMTAMTAISIVAVLAGPIFGPGAWPAIVTEPGGRPWSAGGRGRARRGMCLLCVAGLFFLAGYQRLEIVFASADSDRASAEAGKGDGVRLAQARVRGRRRGSWGDEVELEYVRATDGARRLPARLLLRLDRGVHKEQAGSRADLLLWPGTWVRLALRVRPLQWARNPGTRDREHRQGRRGFGARARLVKPDWVMAVNESDPAWSGRFEDHFGAANRARWRRRVASKFEHERLSAGLVRALALGDRSGISEQSRDAFRRLGLSHLVAISGLHIGFIAGLAGWLALKAMVWFCPRCRRIRVFDWVLVFAGCTAASYAWLTDAGVSVERASLLFGLYALCRLTLRRIAPASALGWVALLVLIAEPAALFDVGAQLSFSACFALIAAGFWRPEPGSAGETQESFASRLLRILSVTFRASLVVSLGTAPLVVQYGFPMAIFSPLFNVVAIPWTGLLALPSSLLAVSTIEVLPRSFLRVLAFPAGALESSAIWLAAKLPPASGEALLCMPVFVALIGLAFVAVRRERWWVAMILWGVCALAGASAISLEPTLALAPRVIFFDVGQGDAALIQGRRSAVLVDTGAGPPGGVGGAALVRGLQAAGVKRIDILVLTHGDLDHRAGLARVLEKFEVGQLWLPDSVAGSKDEALSRAASMARLRGTEVRWQSADPSGTKRVRLADELEIEVLWPVEGRPAVGTSRNENSLVVRIVLEARAYLFAADIGAEVEKELIRGAGNRAADILKVAHHGSRRSSSDDFLHRVSPEVAILSAPCDPARGLPNGQAMERIRKSGARLWWTGRDGAVIVAGRAGEPLSINGWGNPRSCEAR